MLLRRSAGMAAVLAALAVTACGEATTSPTDTSAGAATPTASQAAGPSPTTLGGAQANFVSSMDVTGKSAVTITADTENGVSFFNPTVITGTPGQKITLTLHNASAAVKHNLKVDAQKIDEDLDPNATSTVSFTFPSSGSLQFYCEYHKAAGMIGNLTAS